MQPCQAIYVEGVRTVTCGNPYAAPRLITGKLCSVVTHLCDYHAEGLRNDGYLVDWATPEVTGELFA